MQVHHPSQSHQQHAFGSKSKSTPKWAMGCLFAVLGCLLFIAPRTAQAACEKPNLLIIIDKSGSMAQNNKWTDAKKGISSIVTTYGSKIRFGLETFSNNAVIDAGIPSTPTAIQTALNKVVLGGNTYMLKAIVLAKSHLLSVLSKDKIASRPTSILFITDGAPTDKCPSAEVAALRKLSVKRGTKTEIYDIKTYVIGFGAQADPRCLNNLAVAGGTASSGNLKYFLATNFASFTAAVGKISNTATKEICNGLDDDCDGKIDEDFTTKGKACSAGRGECRASGKFVCAPGGRSVTCDAKAGSPKAELCDGKDNDCDGRVDENYSNKGHSCTKGTGGCARRGVYVCNSLQNNTECNATPGKPSVEICNNKDDDCDGRTDNVRGGSNYTLTQTCKTVCGTGTQKCTNRGWSTCSKSPTTDVCDGKDNDCDGKVDNVRNSSNPLTRGCRKGLCNGKSTCKSGSWGSCVPNVTPSSESCNGIDDDCDGSVDESLTRSCSTACGKGTERCTTGRWHSCNAPRPSTDVCDGKDNDCDGKVDNLRGTSNPLKSGCYQGRCRGSRTCTSGKWDTCKPTAPPKAEECNSRDDDCDGYVDNLKGSRSHYSLTRACKTVCGTGTQRCYRGRWQTCSKAPRTDVCNGRDDDCDGKIDNINGTSNPITRGCYQGRCRGTQKCITGRWQSCASNTKPTTEVCNGKDDDCDGSVDEGITRPCKSVCGSGTERCWYGRWISCTAQRPTTESCDGKDNDCDGKIDNVKGSSTAISRSCRKGYCSGRQTCTSGKWQTCVPSTPPKPETCNRRDDDCDGYIDNAQGQRRAYTLTQSCTTACGKGTQRCYGGRWLTCSSTPRTDVCNGKDDDCDGKIDNIKGTSNPVKRSCKAANCAGTSICTSGKWGACTANSPTAEVCNGFDDDCDGIVDNAKGSQSANSLTANCTTACGSGTRKCFGGIWGACSKSPKPESCNGQDDDCDGKVDNINKTNNPILRSCSLGRCGGKQACKNGSWDACKPDTPPGPEKCDGKDNDCDGYIDNTKGTKKHYTLTQACNTVCGKGTETCISGRWRNCTSAPKPERCNGKDDDCDGSIDENWKTYLGPPARACKVSCLTGTYRCRPDGRWVECNAPKVGAEICDNKDNDCDGKVDENWTKKHSICFAGSGACQKTGLFICRKDGKDVECSVKAPNQPSKEVCDGIDNNCDGRTDENLDRSCKTPCGTGKETCQEGSWTKCIGTRKPSPEKCDNIDNDCNGKVDDLQRPCQGKCGKGTEDCKNGKWQQCSAKQATKETCNNVDDNCDGQIDENLKRSCSTACGSGTEQCVKGKWVFCDAPKVGVEICDNKDNNCDGQVDEVPPKKCSGSCGKGTANCVAGKWEGCSSAQPEPEKCDGKDNDCNGQVDDKLERTCRTKCGEGKQTCKNARWTQCSAPVSSKEICDGKDNDCDGKVDNSAPCNAGYTCKLGACRPLCSGNECPGGMRCVNGSCLSTKTCHNVQCPKGHFCKNDKCVDLCENKQCPKDQLCRSGQCYEKNCYYFGCPKGDRCENGKCVKDPCDGVKCKGLEFCRNGNCISPCLTPCKEGETCKEGKCVGDPCHNKTCKEGEICKGGKCVKNECDKVTCPGGKICVEGKCEHDPCFDIQCPEGTQCKEGNCFTPPGKKKPEEEVPEEKDPFEYTTSVDAGEVSGDKSEIIDQNVGLRKAFGDTYHERFAPGCSCQTESPLNGSAVFFIFLVCLVIFRRPRHQDR